VVDVRLRVQRLGLGRRHRFDRERIGEKKMDVFDIRKVMGNRKLVVVLAVVLFMFVALSVTRCVQIHPLEATSEEAVEEASDDAPEEEGPKPEDIVEEQLSDEDKKTIASYGHSELEVIDILENNVWTSWDEAYVIEFSKSTFREGEVIRPFIIESIKAENIEAHESLVVRTTMSIKTDEGITFMELEQASSISGEDAIEETRFSVTSDAFKRSREYILKKSSESFAVSELASELFFFMGDREQELIDAIGAYRDGNVPTATYAEWDGLVNVDFNERMLYLHFSFDNQIRSKATLSYDMESGTVFMSGGWS
jgi:hypothetical protein